VPGGVQEHIGDLAEALMDLAHEVSVISPAVDDELLPGRVVPAGRAVPGPCNGAARLPRGCPAGLGARWRWLKA
jgi:phosphatidyl-myo-inositol alpha-mannosyltransferase